MRGAILLTPSSGKRAAEHSRVWFANVSVDWRAFFSIRKYHSLFFDSRASGTPIELSVGSRWRTIGEVSTPKARPLVVSPGGRWVTRSQNCSIMATFLERLSFLQKVGLACCGGGGVVTPLTSTWQRWTLMCLLQTTHFCHDCLASSILANSRNKHICQSVHRQLFVLGNSSRCRHSFQGDLGLLCAEIFSELRFKS